MEDELIAILETFKYPIYRQGSMSDEDEYPETFVTFWNTNSPDHSYYDNDDYGTEWTYNVVVYSSNPSIAYSLLDSIRIALKANGWICVGKGQDTESDEETHIGRIIEVIKMNFN